MAELKTAETGDRGGDASCCGAATVISDEQRDDLTGEAQSARFKVRAAG